VLITWHTNSESAENVWPNTAERAVSGHPRVPTLIGSPPDTRVCHINSKELRQIISKTTATLSHQLVAEFGRGFERSNLTRMMKFAEAFPDEQIVATLSHQLSWSHFRELLPLAQPLQREFYAEMCRMEGWSVRTLRGRIDSMLYV
jgi:hypothetical protein